jgi:UDP-N-acetylmuramyl pentapeptide phosphotransferase/UDP-N-acetylglucosamine-1-phosphate transferase
VPIARSAFGAPPGAAFGAAFATAGTGWLLRQRPPLGRQAWARTNHRGEAVTLLAGPAVAVGATVAAALAPGLPTRVRLAVLVAGSVSGALGAYDDLAGTGRDRGFRGHLGALRRGAVSTGALKVLGIGAAGLVAGGLVRDSAVERILAGGVVAGTANLVNLLDLRPGRALKAVAALAATEIRAGRRHPGTRAGAAVPAAAVLGAAAVALPADLGERAMLGDAGANALGALVGLAAASRCSRRGLALRLGVLVTLTAASERVSFTAVIGATPGLRELDALGRRRR